MTDDLLIRLRAVDGCTTKHFRNPDGHEAAAIIERFSSALRSAEAAMSICEPRSNKAQYLDCLNEVRVALSTGGEGHD